MTSMTTGAAAPRRNKSFDETHQQLIEAAVRILSEKGVEALSMAEVARAVGINRTTVYYHFKSREELLDAVKHWSSAQLTKGLSLAVPQQERIDFVSRFVLENPELLKLWIDDFIAVGDIRDRYPFWDLLVEGTAARFAKLPPEEQGDAEVYCVMMLTSAIIGPRVFKHSVDSGADNGSIVERFRREHQRLLRLEALPK